MMDADTVSSGRVVRCLLRGGCDGVRILGTFRGNSNAMAR